MTVAVTRARAAGAATLVCGSTGNTSASAAAYAARAGLGCVVLVPAGSVALGKLAQATALGATVVSVRGNFDDALVLARALADERPVALVNSVNPDRLAGQRTGAFEIVDDLGRAPDVLASPVGNAGNITAYWQGFTAYRDAGRCDSVPAMWGFQAEGAAPLVRGCVVPNPTTVATAIRIGNPASGPLALAAASDSGGSIRAVSDEEILAAWRLLAHSEGVFCEPASAAPVAGLLKFGVPHGATVVCVVTGTGLKDPDIALADVEAPPEVDASLASLLAVLGQGD
jgi:threonine synthase